MACQTVVMHKLVHLFREFGSYLVSTTRLWVENLVSVQVASYFIFDSR